MTRLSVAIMAHPSRSKNVYEMVNSLDLDNRSLTVQMDDMEEGLWPNARRAWLSYDLEADYHLVLQDDLLLCEDLLIGTELAIKKLQPEPGACVSLFLGLKAIQYAVESGRTWVRSRIARSAQALILPTESVEDAIGWCDLNTDPLCFTDDYRISMWMLARGHAMYYAAPCLVEHLGNSSSLVGPVNRKDAETTRRAGVFVGHGKSAFDVDWQHSSRAVRGQFGDPGFYHTWYVGPGEWKDVIGER